MIESHDFLAGPVIPITRQRAESQFLNPDLEEDDVILNIARDEQERIIGFIGALPGSLGSHSRFAWISGWWVDPGSGRQAAMPLFYKFLKQWDMRVMFTDLTPKMREIFGRMNSVRIIDRQGIRLYYRSVLTQVMVQRSPGFRKIRWLLGAIDFFANLFAGLYRIIWKLRPRITAFQIKELTAIDESAEEFIRRTRERNSIPRGKEQIDWIIDHPWILREKGDVQKDKYPFSSSDPGFEQKLVRISEREGKGNGSGTGEGSGTGPGTAFFMVTIHRGHLKIPYLYNDNEDVLKNVAEYLNRLAVSRRVSMLSSFHPGLARALRKVRGPLLFRKKVIRYTACSGVLYNLSEEGFVFQDGDGDAAFT